MALGPPSSSGRGTVRLPALPQGKSRPFAPIRGANRTTMRLPNVPQGKQSRTLLGAGSNIGKPLPAGFNAAHPPGASGGAAPTGPYLDSTAIANINANTYGVNQKIGGIQLGDTLAQGQYQRQAGQLQYAQPRAQLAQMERTNAQGGLYSSVNADQQQNIAHSYADQLTALRAALSGKMQGDAASIAGLRGGMPIYNAGQAAGAAGRAASLAAKNPAAGEPTTLGGTTTGGTVAPATGGVSPTSALARALARRGAGRTVVKLAPHVGKTGRPVTSLHPVIGKGNGRTLIG